MDTGGEHWAWVIYRAYHQAGIEVTEQQFREAYVWAERELARTCHILPEHNFLDLLRIKMRLELSQLGIEDTAKADEIAQICYQSARDSIERARPTLETLSQKYPLVLVSNFYGNVEAVLTDFDLRKYFQAIIESAVVGVRKPDPEIFRLGVQALGLEPQQVLVVGDSFRKDIVPALSLGCRVAWLKGRGWTSEEDAQTHPSIIKNLSDLLKVSLT